MNKKIVLVMGIFLITGLVLLSRNSFASPVLEEENKKIDLILLDDDSYNFKNKIFNYIDLVDNTLIPNTSFNMSSKLNENYDFLTKFAISFILDNREYYDIVDREEYKYVDEYGGVFSTNEYIDVEMIYEITNSVFGVEYYYILNDYIEIDNSMIPLLELEEDNFDIKLDSIVKIDKYDNYMDVIVRYEDNNLDYVYTFDYVDNRYVISNLSIGE